MTGAAFMQPSYAPLWAAIVTAIFGFAGIIVGQRWIAHLAEKTEQRLRANQCNVLRTSLWAELSSLARLVDEEIKYIQNNNFTWVPLVESFKIYISNMQNLGLLTPIEAENITIAYYRYQENAGYIAQLAEDQPDKPAIGRHIKCDFNAHPALRDDVRDSLQGILLATKDAIHVVEQELKKTGWLAGEQRG